MLLLAQGVLLLSAVDPPMKAHPPRLAAVLEQVGLGTA